MNSEEERVKDILRKDLQKQYQAWVEIQDRLEEAVDTQLITYLTWRLDDCHRTIGRLRRLLGITPVDIHPRSARSITPESWEPLGPQTLH